MYHICLVEDETDLANLIQMYLEKSGYQVTVFDKGSDAIHYIGNPVNLWILDIMLKDDLSGYDIIKAIRATDSKFQLFLLLLEIKTWIRLLDWNWEVMIISPSLIPQKNWYFESTISSRGFINQQRCI